MQKQGILYQAASLKFGREINRKLSYGISDIVSGFFWDKRTIRSCRVMMRAPHKIIKVEFHRMTGTFTKQSSEIKSMATETGEELSDDDDDELCPVDCVKEFKTDEEFTRILEKAKETDSLVVIDFYRTSCGSCKYIEQGFAKLCKGSGDQEAPVVFLKHNVLDEYDEQSEVAERLRIRTVPLFHFYKNGVLLEAFPTRDKEKILAAILKYTAPASCDVRS